MSKLQENPLNNNQNFQNNSQTPNNSSSQTNSEEPSLMNILAGALAPLIPVVLAKLTGQKLTTNTTPDNQNVIQQLSFGLQTIINSQNLLLQEMSALKNNAQNLANNFQSLRLTHEKKQIDFNTKQQENYE